MKCEFCGRELNEETAVYFDDVVMCKTCFGQRTVRCSDCGAVIWCENANGDENIVLCDDCYDHYNHCEECGRLIHNDDTYYEDD